METSESGDLRRIGVFGGTFDPVHNAHLLMAECACEELDLDLVYFVPAAIPPHKQDRLDSISSSSDRESMLALAIGGNPRFALLTWELEKGDISYTVDTLEYLQNTHRDARFFLLLGGDSIRDFHMWKSPARIADLAELVAMSRPGHELPGEAAPGVPYHLLVAPRFDLSSSDIRERVRRGASVRYRIPDSVSAYIERHALYR